MNQNDSVITSYFYLVYPHVSYGDISMVYLKRSVEDVINKSLPFYIGVNLRPIPSIWYSPCGLLSQL